VGGPNAGGMYGPGGDTLFRSGLGPARTINDASMGAGMQNAYRVEPDYVKLIAEEFRKTGWGRKPKPKPIELRLPRWSEIKELLRSF